MYWQTINSQDILLTREQIELLKSSNKGDYMNFFSGFVVVAMVRRLVDIFKGKSKESEKGEKKIAKNSIYEILPISLEHRMKGSFIVLIVIIIAIFAVPFLIMIFYNPIHPAIIGQRGLIVLAMISLIAAIMIGNISAYNKGFKKSSKLVGKCLIAILYIFAIQLVFYEFNLFSDILIPIKITLLDNLVVNFIGNRYVSIIIGVITVVCIYCFNYRYILKGVREHGWILEE